MLSSRCRCWRAARSASALRWSPVLATVRWYSGPNCCCSRWVRRRCPNSTATSTTMITMTRIVISRPVFMAAPLQTGKRPPSGDRLACPPTRTARPQTPDSCRPEVRYREPRWKRDEGMGPASDGKHQPGGSRGLAQLHHRGHTDGLDGRRCNRLRYQSRSQYPAPPASAGGAEGVEWRSKRPRVVEVAAALVLPLAAGGSFAVAALAGPLDLGRGPPEGGADLIGLQLGDRPLLPLGVSQLRCRSRPVTITRSP